MGRKVAGVGISLAGFSFWVAACGCCCGTTWSTARAAIAKAIQRWPAAKFNLAMRKKLATIS